MQTIDLINRKKIFYSTKFQLIENQHLM